VKLSALDKSDCDDGHGPVIPIKGGQQVRCRTCGFQVKVPQLLDIYWDKDSSPGDKLEAGNALKKLTGETPDPVRSKTRERKKTKMRGQAQQAQLQQAFNQGRQAQMGLQT
jgi:hypothetical protein